MDFHRRLALLVLLWSAVFQFGGIGGIGLTKVELVDPWFLIVEESSERTGSLANIISDAKLWQEAEAMGINYEVYDDDLDIAKPYLAAVNAAGGVPAYLFINNKQLLRSGKMPTTSDEVRRIIKQEE
jgi:hypothetical protein